MYTLKTNNKNLDSNLLVSIKEKIKYSKLYYNIINSLSDLINKNNNKVTVDDWYAVLLQNQIEFDLNEIQYCLDRFAVLTKFDVKKFIEIVDIGIPNDYNEINQFASYIIDPEKTILKIIEYDIVDRAWLEILRLHRDLSIDSDGKPLHIPRNQALSQTCLPSYIYPSINSVNENSNELKDDDTLTVEDIYSPINDITSIESIYITVDENSFDGTISCFISTLTNGRIILFNDINNTINVLDTITIDSLINQSIVDNDFKPDIWIGKVSQTSLPYHTVTDCDSVIVRVAVSSKMKSNEPLPILTSESKKNKDQPIDRWVTHCRIVIIDILIEYSSQKQLTYKFLTSVQEIDIELSNELSYPDNISVASPPIKSSMSIRSHDLSIGSSSKQSHTTINPLTIDTKTDIYIDLNQSADIVLVTIANKGIYIYRLKSIPLILKEIDDLKSARERYQISSIPEETGLLDNLSISQSGDLHHDDVKPLQSTIIKYEYTTNLKSLNMKKISYSRFYLMPSPLVDYLPIGLLLTCSLTNSAVLFGFVLGEPIVTLNSLPSSPKSKKAIVKSINKAVDKPIDKQSDKPVDRPIDLIVDKVVVSVKELTRWLLPSEITSIVINELTSSFLAIGLSNGCIYLYDLTSQLIIDCIGQHPNSSISTLAFVYNKKSSKICYLVSGAVDGTVCFYKITIKQSNYNYYNYELIDYRHDIADRRVQSIHTLVNSYTNLCVVQYLSDLSNDSQIVLYDASVGQLVGSLLLESNMIRHNNTLSTYNYSYNQNQVISCKSVSSFLCLINRTSSPNTIYLAVYSLFDLLQTFFSGIKQVVTSNNFNNDNNNRLVDYVGILLYQLLTYSNCTDKELATKSLESMLATLITPDITINKSKSPKKSPSRRSSRQNTILESPSSQSLKQIVDSRSNSGINTPTKSTRSTIRLTEERLKLHEDAFNYESISLIEKLYSQLNVLLYNSIDKSKTHELINIVKDSEFIINNDILSIKNQLSNNKIYRNKSINQIRDIRYNNVLMSFNEITNNLSMN